MKKIVVYNRLARKELEEFDETVQEVFEFYISLLREHGRLLFPDARKLSVNLFEIRVEHSGAYRGFYAYMKEDLIIMLHFFQKKAQKTSQRNIKTAQQRAKLYE